MATKALDRVEVWDKRQAAGGVGLSAFPALAKATLTQRLVGDESVSVVALRSTPGYSTLLERRILRTVYLDGSWQEWPILGPWEESTTEQGALLAVTGVSSALELAEAGPIFRTEADGTVKYGFEGLGLTVSEHFNNFINPTLTAAGISYVLLGMNVYDNPNFELDIVGPVTSAATLASSTAFPWIGARSLKVTTTNAINSGVGSFLTRKSGGGTGISVATLVPYVFSCYVYQTSGATKTLKLQMDFYTAVAGLVNSAAPVTVSIPDSTWTRIVIPGTPAATAVLAVPRLMTDVAEGVFDFYVDGVQLEPGTVPRAFAGFNDATLDITYNRTTPLAAFRRMAELLGTEFQYLPLGTTNYLACLGPVNTDQPVVPFVARKNIKAIKRTRRADQQCVTVYPFGLEQDGIPSTMAFALWKVTNLSGSTFQLTDPNGGDNALAFDNQFLNMYIRKVDGSFTQITATVAATQLFTVASAASMANGDLVQLRLLNTPAPDGTQLTYVSAPADRTTYGVASRDLYRPDIVDTVNLQPNPDARLWSAGVPVSWASVKTPLITQISTSNRWQTGGSSAYVQTTAEGEGIETAWLPITPSSKFPSFSGLSTFWLDGTVGRMRVEMAIGKATVSISGTPTKVWDSTNLIATVTVSATAHGLVTGDMAEITGLTPVLLNGIFQITKVDANTFTYFVYSDPGTITTSSPTVRWTQVWPDGTNALAFSSATNAWTTLNVNGIDCLAPGATFLKMRIVQDGAGTTATVTISNSGTTATVTHTAHGRNSGDRALIAGASLSANNGVFTITSTGANTYTYTMGSSPGSSPTGTITATFGTNVYVDAFQITQTPSAKPFMVGSGGTRLHQVGNRALLTGSKPGVKYEISVVDLGRLDPARAALETLQLGAYVSVVDEEWPVAATTRVLELTRNLLIDTDTTITLSDLPEDVTDIILGRLPPSRVAPSLGAVLDLIVNISFAKVTNSPNQVTARLTAAPQGASIYWWRGTAGESPPRMGQIVAGAAPDPTHWALYSTPFTVDQNVTADVQIHAYAVAANRYSRVFTWKVEASPKAAVTATISQITSPANGMKVAWVPNNNTGWVSVYTKRNPTTVSWPTLDTTSTGAPDKTYFRGTYPVDSLVLGWDSAGNPIYSALLYQDTTAYPWANNDVFAAVLIPIDRNLNPGTQLALQGTYVTTPPGSIVTFTMGTTTFGSCAVGTSQVLNWTTANAADGTHDAKIYVQTNGGSWLLDGTVTTPVSTPTYTVPTSTLLGKTSGKFDPNVTYAFKIELILSSGPTVQDTDTVGSLVYKSNCP
jgi:hypothetical protein